MEVSQIPYYKIHYEVKENGEFSYPKAVDRVVWKRTVYHGSERVMIGETENEVKPDGKKVIALKPSKAMKLIEEIRASFPHPSEKESTALNK